MKSIETVEWLRPVMHAVFFLLLVFFLRLTAQLK